MDDNKIKHNLKDSINILTIEIEQSLHHVDKLREIIAGYLRDRRIGEEVISQIELSVYEAIINIIEHSDNRYSDKTINIEFIVADNSAKVKIYSYGEKFDITSFRMPDLDEHYRLGKKRGLGIFFIRTLMDKVEHTYNKNINVLTLHKAVR